MRESKAFIDPRSPRNTNIKKPSRIRRVTLADVAQRANVSRVAVSEVLNERPNCWASEATRERIRQAAHELGYRPNLAARALRLGRTQVIGLVTPGFLAMSPHSRSDGLVAAAGKSDYTVAVSVTTNDAASEDRVIQRLLDRGIDGLVIYPVDQGPHAELRRLVKAGFPVVTFEGANVLDFETDDVSVDCDRVGRWQVRHLLELGRRRICLANMAKVGRMASVSAIREAAIRDELAQAGAPPPIEMRLRGSAAREFEDAEKLEGPMRIFIDAHRARFDGLIGNDPMASLAVRLLRELGRKVPDDVAVIGGGTTVLATFGETPLTSVNAQNDVAGIQAFDLLQERIEGRATPPFRHPINPVQLNVRASTRSITHAK